MSTRASAIMWLLMSLFCGLLSLAGCAGGGYGIWHFQDRIDQLDKRIADDEKEKDDPKNFIKVDKRDEILKRLREADKERADSVQFRVFAIGAAGVSLLPGVMTLAFLIMAIVTFRKKPRPPVDEDDEDEDEDDEGEEDEDEELPAKKKKTDDDD